MQIPRINGADHESTDAKTNSAGQEAIPEKLLNNILIKIRKRVELATGKIPVGQKQTFFIYCLLVLTMFAQDSFSVFRKTVEDSWHADSGKLMP